MWILFSAVVVASLMGSLHCVGMCGPLALWAAGADRNTSAARMLVPTAFYHIGRLLTYSLVGFLAGSLGRLLDLGGEAAGIQILAARAMGTLMIVVGSLAVIRILLPKLHKLSAQWRLLSWRKSHYLNAAADGSAGSATYMPPQPSWLTGYLIRLRPRLFRLPLLLRGLTVGLLTALLPCGWLYLFALLAAATGSALSGAGLMIAFWIGSVPALIAMVVSTGLLTAPVRRVLPLAASFLMVVAGAYTATGRGVSQLHQHLNISSSLLDQLQAGQPIPSLQASDVQAGMNQLVATPLPCCHDNSLSPGLDAGAEKGSP